VEVLIPFNPTALNFSFNAAIASVSVRLDRIDMSVVTS
jgi:hypothetical protein